MGPWMHNEMYAGWDGWATMLAWHTVSWIVVIGLVAMVVAVVMRPRRSEVAASSTAGDILGERYARGEFDTDEYHTRLAALR